MLDSVDTPGLTAFEFATVGSAQAAAEQSIVHHHNAGARRPGNNGPHCTGKPAPAAETRAEMQGW